MTLQGKVFEKLFSAAEIARLSPKERAEYEANMKIYRDYKNTIDTSFGEGFDEGFGEGQTAGKMDAMLAFYHAGVDTATIAKALNMTQAEVHALIEKHNPK